VQNQFWKVKKVKKEEKRIVGHARCASRSQLAKSADSNKKENEENEREKGEEEKAMNTSGP